MAIRQVVGPGMGQPARAGMGQPARVGGFAGRSAVPLHNRPIFLGNPLSFLFIPRLSNPAATVAFVASAILLTTALAVGSLELLVAGVVAGVFSAIMA